MPSQTLNTTRPNESMLSCNLLSKYSDCLSLPDIDHLYNSFKKSKHFIDDGISEFTRFILPERFRALAEVGLLPARRVRSGLFYTLCTEDSEARIAPMDVKRIALAIELFHRASIILDDFVDGDVLRRGLPTHHTLFTPEITSVFSHSLVGYGFQLLDEVEHAKRDRILTKFLKAYKLTANGELADIGYIQKDSDPLEWFYTNTSSKTSEFFDALFVCAGFLRNSSPQELSDLGTLGIRIGKMYQMSNDLYDTYFASPEERGVKSEKANFGFSNLSLPVAILLSSTGINQLYDANEYRIKWIDTIITKDSIDSVFERTLREVESYCEATIDLLRSSSLSENTKHLLTAFLWLITNSFWWNHSEHLRAGYFNITRMK